MTGKIVQVYSMRCARDLELEQLLFVHRVRPSNVLYIHTYTCTYKYQTTYYCGVGNLKG